MAPKRRRRRRTLTEIKAAYLRRGDIYNRRGELDKAKAVFLKVLAIDADDADAHHNIGITYMILEEWEKAAFHFEKALDLNPEMSEVYFKLGYIYMELNRLEEALEMGTAALTDDSAEEKEKAHYVLGRAYIGLDAYEKALYHFQQAHEIGLDAVDLDFYIGNTYGFLRKYELALEHLQKALIKHPEQPTVHNSIALVYMRQGMFEEADKYLTDSLLLDSSCESTYEVLELFEEEKKKQEQENK